MEKINILSIVPYNFLPPKMGGQKGIAFFNRYLSKNINISCVGVKGNMPTEKETYTVIPFFSTSILRYINILNFFPLKKLIFQKNITHVILEHPYLGWLGFLLKHFCKIKIVVHSHNIEALRFKTIKKWWWKILWMYEKWTYYYADHIFFITDEDRIYAITEMCIFEKKCATITYGIDIAELPHPKEKEIARKKLNDLYNINFSDKILLFNGTLDYPPNLAAINTILEKINPILLKERFQYKIIICGKNLPTSYNELKNHKNIVYAGFVENINTYFLGANIFINPVADGGGIKTKLVEALGYNLSCVSYSSGAIGVPKDITTGKMIVTDNDSIEYFCDEVMQIDTDINTSEIFYNHFYWGNIAAKAGRIISGN